MSLHLFSQTCLEGRGYVVVGSLGRHTVGEIIPIDDQPGTAFDGRGVITKVTNKADMEDQLRFMGEAHLIPEINTPHFYRVVAE